MNDINDLASPVMLEMPPTRAAMAAKLNDKAREIGVNFRFYPGMDLSDYATGLGLLTLGHMQFIEAHFGIAAPGALK